MLGLRVSLRGVGEKGGTYYMKADMTPAALPHVSCIPFAVVRFPYRGELFGN